MILPLAGAGMVFLLLVLIWLEARLSAHARPENVVRRALVALLFGAMSASAADLAQRLTGVGR